MSRAIKKIPAGQPGTKRLVEIYGDNFVCLRYRIDTQNRKRLKTVEIIIEEKDLELKGRIPANKIMHLNIAYGEIEVAMLVKNAGGVWNRRNRYWELPYQQVKALGLEKRVIN